jgi:hypothetical protein
VNGALVFLHGLLRWFVIAGGVYAIARAVRARGTWGRAEERASLPFMATLDLQVTIGLTMYLVTSPLAQAARADMAASMKDSVMRFWAVEHVFAMVLAFVLVHVGRVLVKRAGEGAAKRRRALWSFGVALFVILVSTPWPFFPYGRPLFPHL